MYINVYCLYIHVWLVFCLSINMSTELRPGERFGGSGKKAQSLLCSTGYMHSNFETSAPSLPGYHLYV